MIGNPGSSHPATFPPRWSQWIGLAVFTVFVAIGLALMNPNPAATAVAAVLAVGAGAMLALQRRPLLLYAALATGGVAVLGNGMSANVGWFTVCLFCGWLALAGARREGLIYLGAVLVLFTVEWLWVEPDPGWGAWMAGSMLTILAGLLIRHEIDLVWQLRAAQAGLAERARAEERNRIARELHDVIAHTLTVSLLHVSSARLAVEHDPADAVRALAEAERLGRESLTEVRQAVGMLHDQSDTGATAPLPGVGALPDLVDRFRSAGADVTFSVDGDPCVLPATTGLAIYRILQEALTNAIKHAPGSPTEAVLTIGAGLARLVVESAAEPGTGAGLGLLSMRARAELVGGSCEAGPGGRGWLVRASLPFAAGQRREVVT